MADINTATKTKPAKPAPGVFETNTVEAPQLAAPKVDLPIALRELAEKSAAQAKQAYEKVKSAAEDSTALLEETYATAAKGVIAYNLKLIEAARANSNAAFDFASAFAGVKTLSEAVELSSAHTRKQFDALSTQTKELNALAQKVATETMEPFKTGVNAALSKVA